MSKRHMVLIPGANFGPYQPLLFMVQLAGRARNVDASALTWEDSRPAINIDDDTLSAWVNDRVEQTLTGHTADRLLLAGKSLGSFAAATAAGRGLPAIWFTPLFNRPAVIRALEAATAPMLLIGGTADPTWDPEAARGLSPHVLEIPGADHGLIVPGRPLSDYGDTLGRIGTAVERFLDEVVWPGVDHSVASLPEWVR